MERVPLARTTRTLTTEQILAGAYPGDLGQAIPSAGERPRPVTTPDTLTSRNNLACAYRSAGPGHPL